MSAAQHPTWWELLRALWPVFAAIAGLAIGGVVLGLKNMFVTKDQHARHDGRIVACETYIIEQKTALSILPTRQDLGAQIAKQGERIGQVREEIGEQLAEQGERLAGVEASIRGLADQAKTTNTYLHTIIERGLKS